METPLEKVYKFYMNHSKVSFKQILYQITA